MQCRRQIERDYGAQTHVRKFPRVKSSRVQIFRAVLIFAFVGRENRENLDLAKISRYTICKQLARAKVSVTYCIGFSCWVHIKCIYFIESKVDPKMLPVTQELIIATVAAFSKPKTCAFYTPLHPSITNKWYTINWIPSFFFPVYIMLMNPYILRRCDCCNGYTTICTVNWELFLCLV